MINQAQYTELLTEAKQLVDNDDFMSEGDDCADSIMELYEELPADYETYVAQEAALRQKIIRLETLFFWAREILQDMAA